MTDHSVAPAFDEATHTYVIQDGTVVPSVTATLSPIVDYAGVPESILAAARERGTRAHKEIDIICKTGRYPDDPTGYVAGWLRYIRESGARVIRSEQIVYHPIYRYAGTLDQVLSIPGLGECIVDLKCTASIGPWVGVQLAAYEAAYRASGEGARQRIALQLCGDGTYRVHPFKDDGDFSVFLALLTIQKWRTRNGSGPIGRTTPVSGAQACPSLRGELAGLRLRARMDGLKPG